MYEPEMDIILLKIYKIIKEFRVYDTFLYNALKELVQSTLNGPL